ncbi:unnamed protein product, partial [Laminaria digitata]
DNRLTSLRGLSGLPHLRELRLDINNLTSLHELTSLPSLVELSANTNHIRVLPEGFAAALMAVPDPPTANSTKPLIDSGSVESAVTTGGLQKLELYHNRIHCVHPRALEGLMSLTHLDLGRNQLKVLDGRGLESCPALSTLVLSQNLLCEPPSPLCLPLLSELWLSGNQIASMGAWAYAPPPPPPSAQTPLFPIDARGRQRKTCLEPERTPNGGSNPRSALEEPGRGADIGGGFEGRGAGGGREGSTFAQGGVDADDDGSIVWLPTLEVLHLQDNCLESLGGRWSLAGCPLLRSFDASFNRLRAADEIASCLEACADVREVRVHDNPASTCQNYADTIALSCPRLVRMDGAGVDTAVHWRAAAKTYGRRADAILPYLLLNATETSRRGAPPVTVDGLPPAGQTDHATDHAIGEPDVSCLDGQESQQCPWCEEAIPSTPSTESAVSTIEETAPQVHRGGNTAGELEPGGRRGAATSSRGGELTIPNSTKTSGDSNARRWQRRYTCTSCGGELPDTDLWRVQGSRDSQCSVRWDEVLSESRRWREEFCGGGAGAVTKVNADGDGAVVSDAFQSVCLGGREERASMRHRHRREERGVASGGPPAGARTQTEDVTGGGIGKGAARSGSTASERAVTKVQSAFRGFHVRRALQAALDSARYIDEELEGLLSGNGGARFELNTFLAPPPELADGWWGDRSSTAAAPPDGSNAALHGNPSRRARATSNRLLDTACAVVSNTLLSEGSRGSQAQGFHGRMETTTPVRGVSDAGGVRGHGERDAKRSSASGHGARMETQDALDQQADEAMVGVSSGRDSGSVGSGGGPVVGAEEGLVTAWGLSDPAVARAMMKRAKRLRKFQTAEVRRKS